MGMFETIFDLSYLILVIGLGLRMILQESKGAKLFGAMGILLGAGDAFHLIPRVMSYWMENGKVALEGALSWGEAITSITMTVFYLLYYFFYKLQTKENNKKKDMLVYALVALRVIFVILPQNGWGTMPGNYTMAIIRNIPFAILGILLIYWSHQQRTAPGLKHMDILIALSFLFYAPVVLGARFIPALGALMMPKTIAYFLIVILGFKTFVRPLDNRGILELGFVNLILGLTGGVFYREFTKLFDYTQNTMLGKVHGHVLALGVIFMMVIFLLAKDNQLLKGGKQSIGKGVIIFNSGIFVSALFMVIRGIMEVLGYVPSSMENGMISGLAGIGHIILALGFGMVLYKTIKRQKIEAA